GKLGAEADEFLNYISQGANRMNKLISDLLSYSRISDLHLTAEPTDLNIVLQRVLENLRPSIEESRAKVTFDELPILVVSELHIEQMLQNLISNGIKFHGAEPPVVHIGAIMEGDYWTLYVKDNGIGIDPQYFSKIFVIF